MLHKQVTGIPEDMVEEQLAFTTVVAVSGVIHELRLPLQIRLTSDKRHIEVTYDENDRELIESKKEEFRSALGRRGLDIILIRRIMRIFYGKTVEEP